MFPDLFTVNQVRRGGLQVSLSFRSLSPYFSLSPLLEVRTGEENFFFDASFVLTKKSQLIL